MQERLMWGLILGLSLLVACGDDPEDGDDSGTADGGSADGGSGDGGGDGGVGDTAAWTIDHHLTVCEGEGQWLCPLGKRDGAGDWERIYCGIDGLDFVWGTTYQIQAEITGFADPAVDGCGDIWTLLSVDTQTFDGAGAAFELVGLYDVMIDSTEMGGVLGGSHAFVCASSEVCAKVAKVIPEWAHAYTLDMRIGAAPGDPLILESITEH